jgi:hypothetical protein
VTVAAHEMTEKELQTGVIELARVLGWRCAHFRPAQTSKGWRTPVGADGAGWPDLFLCRERVVALELKATGGKLRPEQADWLRALLDAGQEVYVCRPSDLDALALILACRGWPRSTPTWKTANGPALEAATRLREATRKEVS